MGHNHEISQKNIQVQRFIVSVAVILFIIKFTAYFLTSSIAILTDALESIVNIIAGSIGLYSLKIAAQPMDEDHPYGHGKAEFISALFEGMFISIAGVIIIYQSIVHLIYPPELSKLDIGIYLVLFSGIVNYFAGRIAITKGQKNGSIALEASGKHLISDAYSTLGIIIGLIALYFTNLIWIDSAVAIVFGLIIIVTGIKILRRSFSGIMDEADFDLLQDLVSLLEKHRKEDWIDLHNLRIIKNGNVLHVDSHLTVPWYYSVRDSHEIVEDIGKIANARFHHSIEMFIHSDGCETSQCQICMKSDCDKREQEFTNRIEWTIKNITENQKHE